MPKITTLRTKKPPEGFELIEDTLNEFVGQMKDIETDTGPQIRRKEIEWKILQIHHQQSRFVYDLYYKKKEISRELYEWLIENKYADALLIAKWKKQGFEKLCCMGCIQKQSTHFSTACICRVPKAKCKSDKIVQCVKCGCRGCASCD
jgi:bud site selection protein 31